MKENAESVEEEGHNFVRLTRLLTKTNVLNDYELQTALLKGFHREGPDALKCKVNWNKARDEREAVLEFENAPKAQEAKRRWDGKNSFTVDFRGLGAEVIEKPVGWVKALPSERKIYRPPPKNKYPERPPMNASRNQNQGSRYGGYSQRNDAGYQNTQQRKDNWTNQNIGRQQQQRRNNRGKENRQNDGWGVHDSGSNMMKADDGWGAPNKSSRDRNDNWGQAQTDDWEQNTYQRSRKKNEMGRRSQAQQQKNDDWDNYDDGWSNEQPEEQQSGSAYYRDNDWGSADRGKPRNRSPQKSPHRTSRNHNEGWGPGPTQVNDQSRSKRNSRDSSSSRSNRRASQKDEGWGPSEPVDDDDWRQKQKGQQNRSGWDSPKNMREQNSSNRVGPQQRDQEEWLNDRPEQQPTEQRKSKQRGRDGWENPKQQSNREVVNKSYTPGKHEVESRQERAPTPPLPPKWKRAFCPNTKRPYYWHTVTKKVQWPIPTFEGSVPPPPPENKDSKARQPNSEGRRRRDQYSRKSGRSSRKEYSYDE